MNKTLLIMAAGMGSRFGGLKQIEPVGPNNEFIIDYSIYDAIRCGFNKVVFIIKKENYDIFRETVGKRIEDKIKVEYVFQEMNNLPNGYSVPAGRCKPWGTAHAILCAKDVINEPFVIINADDFYGRNAYSVVSDFISNKKDSDKETFAIVGYNVTNTLTENGSVKRGVCVIEEGKLKRIRESKIEIKDNKIIAEELDTGVVYEIDKSTKVSMNMMVFTPRIFKYIEDGFIDFLDKNINKENSEYLIPNVITNGIKEDFCDVLMIDTTSKWVGVTYKEDAMSVINYINDLIKEGEYPNKLW